MEKVGEGMRLRKIARHEHSRPWVWLGPQVEVRVGVSGGRQEIGLVEGGEKVEGREL